MDTELWYYLKNRATQLSALDRPTIGPRYAVTDYIDHYSTHHGLVKYATRDIILHSPAA